MKMKTFVQGRCSIDGLVNDFAEDVTVKDIQTHLASVQQVVAVVVYEEKGARNGE